MIILPEGERFITHTTWDDLRFPASGINPPGAVSDPTRDTADGRLVFAGNAENIVAVQAQMPHNWKVGSGIRPHVHWSPTSSATATVQWKLQYKIANVNAAFPSEWASEIITVPPTGVTDQHEIDGFTEIAMTGKTLSCMILILLSRLGNEDANAATVKLNEFDIHYEIDGLGSQEEYTK